MDVNQLLDALDWTPIEESGCGDDCDGLPYATRRGVLNIGGVEVEVFQLSNGQRVVSEQSLVKFFGGDDD